MKSIAGIFRHRFIWITGLTAIVFSVAAGVSTSGSAAGVDPSMIPTTGEAAAKAEHIVWARVYSVDVRTESGDVWTYTKFMSLKRIKGNIANVFTARLFFVGTFGSAEYVVTDMNIPEFREGEEVVLFLGKNNRQGFPVVDTDNVFRVYRDGNDQPNVSPSPDRLPLYSAASGQLHESPPASVRLDDFLFSLGKMRQR